MSVRWVTDFKVFNHALKRPAWGSEYSDQLMRHLPPTVRYFATVDAVSCYHQLNLSKESRDLLCIITQYGTYQYTTVAQGVCSASDLFNMITDGDIKLAESWKIIKNIVDFLLYGDSIEQL